jgi:YfiH family protein
MNDNFFTSTDGLFLYHQRLRGYKWLRHGFSLRRGNLGAELSYGLNGYQPRETVLANRQELVRSVYGTNVPLAILKQNHSDRVIAFSPTASQPLSEGDGWATDQTGVLLAVQTADCLPVLLVDPVRRVVAAVHAGWRGILQKIGQKSVHLMRTRFSCRPCDCIALIGPCIRRCCYEVGKEVIDAFSKELCDPCPWFSEPPPGRSRYTQTKLLDLAEALKHQLLEVGLLGNNIDVGEPCTFCDTSRFFSHRAEGGRTGRMMAVIGIVDG